MGAAEEAVISGTPINRPLWWVDPQDPLTFDIDDGKFIGKIKLLKFMKLFFL
jgi:alpha-glucosidase (family GH31 glycosyl hydrolase)